MPPYGKNMRSCCDSVAERGRAHIKGCRNYRVFKKKHFIRMDDSTETIMLDKGLYSWLTDRKLRLTEVESIRGMGDVATIVACDGIREGMVMTVEYAEAA